MHKGSSLTGLLIVVWLGGLACTNNSSDPIDAGNPGQSGNQDIMMNDTPEIEMSDQEDDANIENEQGQVNDGQSGEAEQNDDTPVDNDGPQDSDGMPEQPVEDRAPLCVPPRSAADASMPTTIVGTGRPASVTADELQSALDRGGVVVIDGGEDPFTLTLSSELVITGAVVFDGRGLLTLDGGERTRVFRKADFFSNDTDVVVIQNLTIQNANHAAGDTGDVLRDDSGGAFFGDNFGRVEFHNVVFRNNRATALGPDIGGGAIFARNVAEVYVSACTFTGNTAANGAAITTLNGDVRVFNSRFEDNHATGLGGIGPFGNSGNDGDGGLGGAISVDGMSLFGINNIIEFCGNDFVGNTANHNGGACYLVPNNGAGSTATIDYCSFIDNHVIANEPGGNIDDMGTPGYGDTGGAVFFLQASLQLTRSLFANNSADWQGGGIFFGASDLEAPSLIENCTFAGNAVTLSEASIGGGIRILATSGGSGGNVVTIQNCTVAHNTAAHFAAGMWGDTGQPITVNNTLFYDNRSEFPYEGQNVNRQMDGEGNLQFPHLRPDDEPEVLVTADTMVANPLLEELSDNGGPTETMAIEGTSPAIDGGTVTGAPVDDQRGQVRDSRPDIGAYEAFQ